MPKGDNPNSRKGMKNLIPLNKRSKETQREIQRMGAQASNAAQKRAKTFAEGLRILLQKTITDPDGNTMTVDEAINLAMLKQAMKGNVKAFESVRDTVGQKPVDKVEQVVITPEVDFDKLEALRKDLRNER